MSINKTKIHHWLKKMTAKHFEMNQNMTQMQALWDGEKQ